MEPSSLQILAQIPLEVLISAIAAASAVVIAAGIAVDRARARRRLSPAPRPVEVAPEPEQISVPAEAVPLQPEPLPPVEVPEPEAVEPPAVEAAEPVPAEPPAVEVPEAPPIEASPVEVPEPPPLEPEVPEPVEVEAAAPEPEPAVAPVEVAPPEPEPPRKPDFGKGLRKTRSGFIARLEGLLKGRKELDQDTLDEVESVLFGADLGVRTADDLMEAARAVRSSDEVYPALESRALEILTALPSGEVSERGKPHVVVVVGVNGSGKTTTIGKLAARWIAQGDRVLIAAGDTYRAAAVDQLEVWAERARAEFVKGAPGGDPAAVAFDAVKAALARDLDVVLVDTAGRLQTDQGLMDELTKVVRVVKKEMPDAPHEVLLVLDATTGQNAIRQAQEFRRAVDVTGLVLAKLDGTAKGGVVLGIAQEIGIPVRYVGMGEGLDDLYDFDPEAFVTALFARGGDAAGS
jgi:fused signal recognition particle receptor